MGVARKVEDVDTHAYWADVNDALMEVCHLSPEDAAAAVSESRQTLSCLSDWGRLLAYHESVPQVAEDLWRQGPGARIGEEEAGGVQRKLIEWYAERNRGRGLPHGAANSSVQGKP